MVIKKTKKLSYEVDKETSEEEMEQNPDIRVIEQEVKIVRALACNDLNKRNKQIRKLRKWLSLRAQSSFPFTEDDFTRIWKGLYYNMWMSDKPLVQEELAETLGQLLDCFEDVLLSIKFFGAFLDIMQVEWFGIDQWRMDKFLMLVRRMLRYMFRALQRTNWDSKCLEAFNQQTFEKLLENTTATGLTMHFLDIFFEELAKVSEGKIDAEQVGIFMKPFVWFFSKQRDPRLISHCRTRVFYHLLYQSALGREYMEKYNAWREMGFPTKSIDDLEKADTDSVTDKDEPMEVEQQPEVKVKHMDPRAGNVDVFMPELPLDGKYVIDELNLLLKTETYTKCRKMLKKLLGMFESYQNGVFPLGVKTMPRFEAKSEKPLIKEKIKQLDNLENEMFSTVRKLKQLNKRRRRKLLKSIDYSNLDESNFEQAIEKSIPKQCLKARKKKAALACGWIEEELEVTPSKKIRKNEVKKGLKDKMEKQEKVEHNIEFTDTTKDEERPKSEEVNELTEEVNGGSKGKVNSTKNEKKQKATTCNKKESTAATKFTPDDGNKESSNSKKHLRKAKPSSFKKKEEATVACGLSTNVATVIDASVNNNDNATGAAAATIDAGAAAESDAAVAVNDDAASPDIAEAAVSEWDQPLSEGEVEYFIPSRKQLVRKTQSMDLVRNPFVKVKHMAQESTNKNKLTRTTMMSPKTPSSVKRVKIQLKNNTEQKPSEYIKQIKNSPDLPYDASKKPGKGLLKPNSIPSPINPFYKRKIGLRLLNDTL